MGLCRVKVDRDTCLMSQIHKNISVTTECQEWWMVQPGYFSPTMERNKLMMTGQEMKEPMIKKWEVTREGSSFSLLLDTWIQWWDTPCRCCTWPDAWQFPQQPLYAGQAATPWTGAPVSSSPEIVLLQSRAYYWPVKTGREKKQVKKEKRRRKLTK